ncbi:hypothetical protein [Tenacibaculum halocynthiae]|uniref:hypothetical protein n=1 Tax=Tenacibaculum halocynthiae TaxID=1254437 RepID=UPI003D655321
MTELEALKYLEDFAEDLFEKYSKLFFLAPVLIQNKYVIHANIEIDQEEIITLPPIITKDEIRILDYKNITNYTLKNIIEEEVFEKGVPYKISSGNSFKFLNSDISTNNTIRNHYNERSGTLGLIFKLKKSNDYYFLSNQHVIGRTVPSYNDPIEKKITDKKFKKIGNYKYGEITHSVDYAYGKFLPNISIMPSAQNTIFISLNTNRTATSHSLKIGSQIISIYASNAYIKLDDNYFFGNKGKVMKNQIIVKKTFVDGLSGSIALNSKGSSIVGLLFASEGNYSALNNINLVFEEIKKNNPLLTTNNIEIINHF